MRIVSCMLSGARRVRPVGRRLVDPQIACSLPKPVNGNPLRQELWFRQSRFVGWGVPVARMTQKRHETSPEPLKLEQVKELQALLQTDNTAPVDRMTFGMRLAELIIRVPNMRKRRQRK
jgi:hypothetical protein